MRFIKAKSHSLRFQFAGLSAFVCAYLWLISALALSVFAQSGRIKPTETPKPTPRPNLVYFPTQASSEVPKTAPTPTKPKKESEEEEEIINVESNLVPIPASVLDAQNRAVTNLKIDDFELLVDGKPAEIGELSYSDTPVRLALLFDNSSSVMQAREFEIKAAVKFFKRVLRPEKDLAAIYSFSDYSRLEQPLTKNISQLTSAIENFPPPQGATAILDAIIKASDYLRESSGRRVIVIVSDGEDTYSDLTTTLEKVVQAVQIANCQVYVVKTTDFENLKRTGQRGGNANVLNLTAERRMQELAAQTGGAVYSPIDERELDQAFAQISAQLAQQYVLSYYPENETDKRGEFRTISLAVKGRQNLSVRTRKGYFVPKKRNTN